MSTEQLPDGLQLAVNLLEGDRDAFVVCHRHPIHGLEQEDAEIAGEYLGAINAIRDEHAKRLTLQHHAADMAQQIEDLRFAAEAGGRRIAELEAERDALRAKLAAIEAQAAPDEEAAQTGFRAYDGSGWSETATPWQIWRDAVKWAISARHVPARAVPDWWRLVPVEPTREMISAARDAENCGNPEPHFSNAYRAMIAAAPEHKSTGCGACGDACAKSGSCRLADESPEAV